jgi:hypothetical protein
VGGILALAVIAFLVYEAIVFGPTLFAQYEFKDAVDEEAKFSRGRSVDTMKSNLTKKAGQLGLPITRGQIKVTQQPTNTRIQVKYQLSVEWRPGKPYKWDVDVVGESVIF